MLAVPTHRPLFWFLGRGEVTSMDDLRGRRLAVHPPRTAPGCFARIVLRRHGSPPIATCSASYEPRVTTRWICGAFATVRSMRLTWAAHRARTGRPRGGLSGPVLGQRPLPDPHRGNRRGPARIPLDNPALQALVRANQRALLTIAEQPQLAIDYIAFFLGRLTRDEVQRYYKRYVGPYFTSDGRIDLNVAQHAADAVATELGVAAASVDQMCQPALGVTVAALLMNLMMTLARW